MELDVKGDFQIRLNLNF